MKKTGIVLANVALAILAGCSSEKKAENGTPASQTGPAPDTYKVKFDTSKGAFTIEVTRALAPIGADRFYDLVQQKFFDEGRFFRVLKGFVVQFGINKDPQVQAKWERAVLMLTIAILLALVSVATFPCWSYSAGWGYVPSAVAGTLLICVAMIAVGGLSQYAAGNRAKLIRYDKKDGKQTEYALKLSSLLKDGDPKANVMLQPGDVIIIPESMF